MIGRKPTNIQSFIKRGSPKKLPEAEFGILARYFGVDESLLGGPLAIAAKLAFGSSQSLPLACLLGQVRSRIARR